MDLAQVREELDRRGMSLRAAARAIHYDVSLLSRVLRGKQPCSDALASALTDLLSTTQDAVPSSLEEANDSYAQSIRETSQRLVALDNELNGLPLAQMAARSFKMVYSRLGSGNFDSMHERDIQAAAAELAEVTGWVLYSAGDFTAARRYNHEALLLAHMSGDRSTELITLQNMSMLAGVTGRPQEEISIAQSVLDRGRLTPRVEALFHARSAHGLSKTGRELEAQKAFKRARSLLHEGGPSDEPHWSWWISDQEIDRQEGCALHETGRWKFAVPVLERATNGSGPHVGYKNVTAVRLLDSLLQVGAWHDATAEAERLVPVVGEIGSVLILRILEDVIERSRELIGVPTGLRETLNGVENEMKDDPFEL